MTHTPASSILSALTLTRHRAGFYTDMIYQIKITIECVGKRWTATLTGAGCSPTSAAPDYFNTKKEAVLSACKRVAGVCNRVIPTPADVAVVAPLAATLEAMAAAGTLAR